MNWIEAGQTAAYFLLAATVIILAHGSRALSRTVQSLSRRVDELQRSQHPSITCPVCGRTSYNPNDVRERYCGACHAYLADDVDDPPPEGTGG